MLILFWDMKEAMTLDFFEKSTTVNISSYSEFLLPHSAYFLNDHRISSVPIETIFT